MTKTSALMPGLRDVMQMQARKSLPGLHLL
ncbi:hypothetical protein E3G53_000001, partial [Mycobacteroides abscessus]|nr:hypothetical protein [Mycobacteroides abscessus]